MVLVTFLVQIIVSGSLNVEANVPNGLFVEWDNDDLVIKHTKGAGGHY